MPKVEIDYSNTVFYKIYCKDANVSDLYVGHTTNFVQRKHAHKQSCKNPKSSNYNCKLYNAMRQHGGWDNWIMEIIAFHNCNDHYDARIKEQEYFVSCKATLNSIEPMPKPKTIVSAKPQFDISELNSQQFYCNKCNYCSCNKNDFNKHCNTIKHNTDASTYNKTNKVYTCTCGTTYKHRQSLHTHKQKCVPSQTTVSNSTSSSIDISLVIDILKQNQELKELIIEQSKQLAFYQQKQCIEQSNIN